MKNKLINNGFDKAFDIINHVILTLVFLIVLYPLVYVLSCSFSPAAAVLSGKVWLWPVGFTLDGYTAVFSHHLIISGFLNSIFYTGVGTAINLFMTVLAAYPLSRKDFYGRNAIMFLFVFTMLFNGGLIPNYMLMKDIGLIHKWWVLVIPVALSAWNVIVTRTYFQNTIPVELLEAAQIDGCNDFKFVWRMVLPLSKPILAVMGLFYCVGHWNSYFSALIYINDTRLYPLQLVLRSILVSNQVDMSMLQHIDAKELAQKLNASELLKYSLIVVSSVPVLALYPFVQKHFIKGMMIGSLKG